MSRALAVVVGFVAGAAGGFAASWLAAPSRTDVAAGAREPAGAPAPAARSPDLERRLARIEDAVAALRPRRSDAPADPTAVAAGATDQTGAGDGLAPRVAALDGRLTALEAMFAEGPLGWRVADLSKLADEDLLAKARGFSAPPPAGNPEAAIRYWDAVRQRKQDAATQDEAWFALGTAYRATKDHAKEEAAFREVMRMAGPETSRGTWAQFQVGWSRVYQNDDAGALEQFERVASAPATEELVVIHALLRAGVLAQKIGDSGRARNSLDRLLRDYTEKVPATQAWILAEAKKTLAAAEGR